MELWDDRRNTHWIRNSFFIKKFNDGFAGTIIGMLPGLGPMTAIALMIPITYGFEPSTGLILMAGVYYGAVFGGSTTSI